MSSKESKPATLPDSTKHPSKGPVIAIFVILILFIIGYVVYLFEAYKSGIFPFTPYGPPVDDTEAFDKFAAQDPNGAIRPLGPVISIGQGDQDTAATNAGLAMAYMCDWYNQGSTANPSIGYIPLPGDPSDPNSQAAQFKAACTPTKEQVSL